MTSLEYFNGCLIDGVVRDVFKGCSATVFIRLEKRTLFCR